MNLCETPLRQSGALEIGAKLNNLLHREFGQPIAFTNWAATLCNRVLHVLGSASFKQMSGIATRRVIAFVAYMFGAANRPVVKYPRHARGDKVDLSSTQVTGDITVSLGVQVSRPTPASISLYNIIPESLNGFGIEPRIDGVINIGRICLHINHWLMCHAPGGVCRAGALHYNSNTERCQVWAGLPSYS